MPPTPDSPLAPDPLAAVLAAPGPASAFRLTRLALPPPGAGDVRIRHTVIGLDFIDVYHRSGRYALPPEAWPAILGVEAAGVVEAVGPGVTDLAPGDRVAYAGAIGAYAGARNLAAARLVRIPDGVDDAAAATALARGITVHMVASRVVAPRPGTIVLVLAAAGGLGAQLARAAKRAGATVIGTVGSAAKLDLARAAGADHVIVGRDADLAAEIRRLTNGALVDIAYDGVGGATLAKTLACVRPFGTVVSLGEAGGPIPPIAAEELGLQRSLIFARPSVMQFMRDVAAYRAAATAVLAEVAAGIPAPPAGPAFPLADVARAHEALEAGAFAGAATLIP
ncbi:MAG TPA: quinone oxidoreductase [Kofleriaceae bacterium]